jgi:hypothetical protein
MLVLFSTKSSAMCRNLRQCSGEWTILQAKACILNRFGRYARRRSRPKSIRSLLRRSLCQGTCLQAKTIFFALT